MVYAVTGNNHEYYLTIVEEGTLTRAAEKLYVSQSSLSQYLKRLENKLGVMLFDRNTSPLKLTYAGKRYYEHVRQMVQMDENLRRELQDIRQENSGHLRVGLALWRGSCLLPEVFPLFHERYPGIHIDLTEGSSDRLEAALVGDKIDLAIMSLPHSLDYSSFTCTTLFEEHILLAVPEQNPYVQELLKTCSYRRGYPVAPFSIFEHLPLIMTKPGQNSTREVNHLLGKNHVEPHVLLETGNLTTAINIVAQGVGCVFVPEGGISVNQHPGKLVYMAMDTPNHAWTLAAVYRKNVYLSRLAQLFVDTLLEVYSGR